MQHQQSTQQILTSQCSHCRSTSYPETFNKELLSCVRSGLAAVTVPSWVEQPPTILARKDMVNLRQIRGGFFLRFSSPSFFRNYGMVHQHRKVAPIDSSKISIFWFIVPI
jgi:hypothetical protein